MKTCFKCHESKELSEFYAHKAMKDGHLNKCKACTKNDVKANTAEHADYYRAYDRARHYNGTKPRYSTNGSPRAKDEWAKRNPEKRAAHKAVGNAVRSGLLVKPDVCSRCREPGVLHGHHEDYSRQLDVEWLCRNCHGREHRRYDEDAVTAQVAERRAQVKNGGYRG